MMCKPGPGGEWKAFGPTQTAILRALILDAASLLELPRLFVPRLNGRAPLPKDPPTEDECRSLFRFLRDHVLRMYARWDRADSLALVGRDLAPLLGAARLISKGLKPTEADAHATYRALVARTGHPIHSGETLRRAFGLFEKPAMPSWWPKYSAVDAPFGRKPGDVISPRDLTSGLYPTFEDVVICALLCLWRSAWNLSTLLP